MGIYDNRFMRVSQGAEYAVRALLDLAIHGGGGRGIRSSEVARRTGLPEKFLEAIWKDLRVAGLVASKRGPDGGHQLAQDPSHIRVSTILDAIDGPLLNVRAKRCEQATPEDACLSFLWGRVERAAQGVLETVTLEDLRQQTIAPGALDFTI